jgi:type II secretory pathway pseudopilin PulG
MFAPSISRVFRVNARRALSIDSQRSVRRNCSARRSALKRLNGSTLQRPTTVTLPKLRGRISAFTLLELLIVIGIIGLMLVLVAPAFKTIKGGNDVTSAAYTIKGVLDAARTYAKANNTYTWVGFFEEDASTSSTNPATAGLGRLVISIVASKDGTMIYADPPTGSVTLDSARLIQLGKLTKIENSHLKTFTDGSGAGESFDTRPLVGTAPRPDLDARIGDTTPRSPVSPLQASQFQYPVGSPSPPWQYQFTKIIQFSPSGDSRVANTSYSAKPVVEVGIQPTHGTAPDNNSPNVAAVQLTGFGGNVKIYRR